MRRSVLKLYETDASTELHTDASKYGYDSISLLCQRSDDNLLHVYYGVLRERYDAPAEKYSSYKLGVFAILKSLKEFHVYLIDIPFKIVKDYKVFNLTMSRKDLCVRITRWALQLEEFNYKIEHHPEKAMTHVDM